MFQKTAIQKCFQCGLRNFSYRTRCERCKSDLSLTSNAAENDKQVVNSAESDRSKLRFAWILGALVFVLFGLMFYMRQSPQEITQVTETAAVVELPVTPEPEQPAQDTVDENTQSEAAATHIVLNLKDFQDATESGMDYDEYDKKLTILKTDLNDKLPSFVRHNPNDESFREEVASALRDYTAAGNWWKTTITNSTVFTEADRNERTQKSWESARTHVTKAETLVR